MSARKAHDEDKLAAAALKLATTAKDKRKSKCWEIFKEIMWGEEGAKHFDLKLYIVIGMEAIFLAGVLIDAMCGGALKEHGIHPRDFPMGLLGIFFAPFLHKGVAHFLVNMVPFGILSMLVLLRKNGIAAYFVLTGLTIVLAGMLVWTLGAAGSNHIGSSGLIFSYFGYLIVSGVFRRSIRDFVVGVVVFLLYSSIFWGVLPINERISWEAHLFGLLTGCVFGIIDAKLSRSDPDDTEAADEERQKFLP